MLLIRYRPRTSLMFSFLLKHYSYCSFLDIQISKMLYILFHVLHSISCHYCSLWSTSPRVSQKLLFFSKRFKGHFSLQILVEVLLQFLVRWRLKGQLLAGGRRIAGLVWRGVCWLGVFLGVVACLGFGFVCWGFFLGFLFIEAGFYNFCVFGDVLFKTVTCYCFYFNITH